jgi:hypothetical protein
MKRLICFILISVLIAGLTGCNKKEDKDTTTSRQSSVTETTEKTSKTTETKNEETKSTKSVLRDDEEPEEKIKKIVLIPVQDSLYPISKYTGYFDIEYEVYIAFKDYLLDSEFDKNGVAVFEKDGNFGLVNANGKIIFDAEYDSINGNGYAYLAYSSKEDKSYIIQDNKIIFEWDKGLGNLYDNRALVEYINDNKTRYGYIDEKGEIAIKSIYTEASNFKDGYAVVKNINNDYLIIDEYGNKTGLSMQHRMFDISDGMVIYTDNDTYKFGYATLDGLFFGGSKYMQAYPYNNGKAIVGTGDDYINMLFGIINKKDMYIVSPTFSFIKDIGNDLFAVNKTDNPDMLQPELIGAYYPQAIMDETGKLLTGYNYYNVSKVQDGYISVTDGTETFFLDKNMKRASEMPSVKGSGTFTWNDNYFKADLDGDIVLFNKDGKEVFRTSRDIKLNDNITVKSNKLKRAMVYLAYYPEITGIDAKIAEGINEKLRSGFTRDETGADSEYMVVTDIRFTAELMKNIISIKKYTYMNMLGAAHPNTATDYLYINYETGDFYRLSDIFKKYIEYVEAVNELVLNKMNEINKKEGNMYFTESYRGVGLNQNFKLTDEGVVFIFGRGEISSTAIGEPEILIPYKDLEEYLDMDHPMIKAYR